MTSESKCVWDEGVAKGFLEELVLDLLDDYVQRHDLPYLVVPPSVDAIVDSILRVNERG